MVSLLFQNGDTKYHVLVSQKSTRFYRLYPTRCVISTRFYPGKDRLDVFYQLDFIQVRIDSMCFINSISRGSTRFQAAGGKGEFRGRLDI